MRTRRATALLATLALAVAACSDGDDGAEPDGTGPVTSEPAQSEPTATVGTDGAAPATDAAATTAAGAPATSAPATPPASVIDDTQAVGGTLVATVDLDTGAATVIGRTGDDVGVLGLAAGGHGRLTGLTDAPALVTMPVGDPAGVLAGVPVIGVEGSTLLAIDGAPDGSLLALDDGGALWTVDPGSGAAVRVGPPGGPLVDPGLGFDVDPTDGSIVVADATGTHLRLDPETAAVTESPPVTWAAGDATAVPPRIVAVAHAGDGTRYAIDAASASLVSLDDDGRLDTIGPLGVEVTDGASLDIGPDGLAVLTSPG